MTDHPKRLRDPDYQSPLAWCSFTGATSEDIEPFDINPNYPACLFEKD